MDTDLKQQMLDAFLAIEPHDQHVQARREVKREQQAPVVAASIAERRLITGATGVVERVTDKKDSAPVVVDDRVDNPLTTYAQTIYEMERGYVSPGKIVVQKNLTTTLGGFARFHGNEAQNEAVKQFRSLYERAQLGGAKAVDPSKEPVDGGWINPEAIFEIGADARRSWAELSSYLGRVDTQRMHFVVVLERGPTAYARWRFNDHSRDGGLIAKGQVEIRRIADSIAVWAKLQSRGMVA